MLDMSKGDDEQKKERSINLCARFPLSTKARLDHYLSFSQLHMSDLISSIPQLSGFTLIYWNTLLSFICVK